MKRLALLLPLFAIGCVDRELHVNSNPQGAVVWLNNREMGRTPFHKQFLWYGNYDVVLRKDGYTTQKTNAYIVAPFWQWVPLDLVTDFLPLHDDETISFTLSPQQPADPNLLITNGIAMQRDLQSSEHTVQRNALDVKPTTAPTTHPSTQPK